MNAQGIGVVSITCVPSGMAEQFHIVGFRGVKRWAKVPDSEGSTQVVDMIKTRNCTRGV